MSEDCHDSNNEKPYRVTNGDTAPNINPFTGEPRWLGEALENALNDQLIAIPCAECGEPVHAAEAYPMEIENFDGTSEIAVFHTDFAKLCPLKWASKRLEAVNAKMR